MSQKENMKKDDGDELADEGVYRSLIGCLMYLTTTRPDIMFHVSILCRFLNCASELHMMTAKRLVRYLKGTLTYGIRFSKSQNFNSNLFYRHVGSLLEVYDSMLSVSGIVPLLI